MDSHVSWLRRRIIFAVAGQAAATFAVVFAAVAAVLIWRVGLGILLSLALAAIGAQVVAIGRLVWAARTNPLGYNFAKYYIDSTHHYRPLNDSDRPSRAHEDLPGFYSVATIHDPDLDPAPVFDLFQTVDETMTAVVSRASGALWVVSRLADGRLLVTDPYMPMPHEDIVANLATDTHPVLVVAAHQAGVDAVGIVAMAEPHAIDMVIGVLELECRTYRQLGPTLASFLDLQPHRRNPGRLALRLSPEALLHLCVARDANVETPVAPLPEATPAEIASESVLPPAPAPVMATPPPAAPPAPATTTPPPAAPPAPATTTPPPAAPPAPATTTPPPAAPPAPATTTPPPAAPATPATTTPPPPAPVVPATALPAVALTTIALTNQTAPRRSAITAAAQPWQSSTQASFPPADWVSAQQEDGKPPEPATAEAAR